MFLIFPRWVNGGRLDTLPCGRYTVKKRGQQLVTYWSQYDHGNGRELKKLLLRLIKSDLRGK